MGRVICISSAKGGSGKSTSSVALAAALPTEFGSCLLIDMDPQGNASAMLGHQPTGDGLGSADLLTGRKNLNLEDLITFEVQPGLDLIPAEHTPLVEARNHLANTPGAERVLARTLAPLVDTYDWIIIDTPPGVGDRLTWNAIAAATHVVAIIDAGSMWSLEGAAVVSAFVDQLQAAGLTEAVFLGGVLNRVEPGRLVSEVVMDTSADTLTIFDTTIPRRTAFQQAELLGRPLVTVDRPGGASDAAVAVRELTSELVQRAKAADRRSARRAGRRYA